jgi:NADH-quinone oxidoreductase subunit L
MSRQVFMVFFGEKRWKEGGEHDEEELAEDKADHGALDAAHGHHGEPHESPWTMWVPLAVLAVLAFAGGALNLPFTDKLELLGRWLHPVVGLTEAEVEVATGMKIALAAIATVAGLAGIAGAYLVYLRQRAKAIEPDILLRAWRVDETISAAVDGPGRAAAAFAADVVDKRGIDGAVNGIGVLVREGGTRLRAVQTGYVRSYALAIAAGSVLLLGWFITRAGL